MNTTATQDIRAFDLVKRAVKAVDLEKIAAETSQNHDGLPSSSFADQAARRFPICSPEDCILSAAEAFGTPKIAAAVTSRIFGAAKIFGVIDTVNKMAAEIMDATEPRGVKYALDIALGGRQYRLFPFASTTSLKEASETFWKSRHKLPWAARQKAAGTLFEEIMGSGGNAEVGVTPVAFDYITKAAGFGLPSYEAADVMLMERRRRDVALAPSCIKVAAILRSTSDFPDWDEYAMKAFDALDDEQGLKLAYGVSLELPEEALYHDTVLNVKTASEDGLVHLMNGKTIRLSDLDWAKVAAVDPALYNEVKGVGFERASEILETWPRPDADVLIEMLSLQTA